MQINDAIGSLAVELTNNRIKLVKSESLIRASPMVHMSAVQHLQDIVIIDRIVQLLGNTLELLKIDKPVLVLIVKRKNATDAVLGLRLADPRGNDINELLLTDGLVLVLQTVDEVQNKGVPSIEAQLLQDLVDLHRIDRPTAVLVKHLKGLHQLIVILSSQTVPPRRGRRLSGLSRWGRRLCTTGLHSAHNIQLIIIIFISKGKDSGAHNRTETEDKGNKGDQFERIRFSRVFTGIQRRKIDFCVLFSMVTIPSKISQNIMIYL